MPPPCRASHDAVWCILSGAQPVLYCAIMAPDFKLAAAIVLTTADTLLHRHTALCCKRDGSGAGRSLLGPLLCCPQSLPWQHVLCTAEHAEVDMSPPAAGSTLSKCLTLREGPCWRQH